MKYNIAFGKYRDDKRWQNKQITWDEFIKKISITHRTAESIDEYLKFTKDQQDEKKDIGGFVSGHLAGGRRLMSSITTKQILTFDADDATPDFWEKFCINYGCTAAIYTTHKHTPDKPRYRLLIPLAREVFCDEYTAIVRRIASDTGIDMFDHTGYQVNRLMYWPSTSKDGEFIFKEQKGSILNPDDVLNTYSDWHDVSQWPMGLKENKTHHTTAKKQGDPLTKPGLIGAFNRAYNIDTAIEFFLGGIYDKCAIENRYTYKEGSTAAGVVVYGNMFIFSHHSTDPISNILCNAFDMVRLHKFGDLDTDDAVPINKRPSYVAMCDFVSSDTLVKQQLGEAKLESAKAAFEQLNDEEIDLEWLKEMDVDRKGNYLSTINNVALILEHDPIFKGNIYYDEFKEQAVFRKDLPWRKLKKRDLLNDNDLANIENYIEKVYKLPTGAKLNKGLLVVLEKYSFHPVVEYLRSTEWDKKERVRTLLHDFLGTKNDAYTQTVITKALVACVARVMQPGIKFDNVVTLIGEEGQGKSQLFDRLGGKWFTDSFNLHMLKGKEAYEQIQGVWIIEIGELSGMANAEVERVKSFIAARKDRYRSPYARTVGEDRPRQCVFFATTNELTPLKSQRGNRRFWPVTTHETKPKRSAFDLDKDEIMQIWAEATYMYDNGEVIYMEKAMVDEAVIVQEDHTEENPLVEMIYDYMTYKIPENWYRMDKWSRIDFINSYDSQDKSKLIERSTICKYEIWEMVLGKKEAIDTFGLKPIKQAMSKIKGWEKVNEHVYFGTSYPKHKGSYRKTYTLESILA